ncbi:MAG: hypothetical protein IJF31_05465, partial [Clostridia bacterium]|nr:hypothetical protein [Clostridia bacterium]
IRSNKKAPPNRVVLFLLSRLTGQEMPLIAEQSMAGRMPIWLCQRRCLAAEAFCFPQAPSA